MLFSSVKVLACVAMAAARPEAPLHGYNYPAPRPVQSGGGHAGAHSHGGGYYQAAVPVVQSQSFGVSGSYQTAPVYQAVSSGHGFGSAVSGGHAGHSVGFASAGSGGHASHSGGHGGQSAGFGSGGFGSAVSSGGQSAGFVSGGGFGSAVSSGGASQVQSFGK